MSKRGSSLGRQASAGDPPQAKPAILPPQTPGDLDGFVVAGDAVGSSNSVESMGQLDDYQHHVIHSYSDVVYTNINGVLRNRPDDVTDREQAQRHIDALDQAFATVAGAKSAALLKRGVNSRELSKLLAGGKLLPGATFRDLGIVSTTHAENIPGMWQGKDFQITIRTPKGAKALWVQSKSEMPSEREVLLPRGSTFRVVSGNKSGKTSLNGNEQWNVTVDLVSG